MHVTVVYISNVISVSYIGSIVLMCGAYFYKLFKGYNIVSYWSLL